MYEPLAGWPAYTSEYPAHVIWISDEGDPPPPSPGPGDRWKRGTDWFEWTGSEWALIVSAPL